MPKIKFILACISFFLINGSLLGQDDRISVNFDGKAVALLISRKGIFIKQSQYTWVNGFLSEDSSKVLEDEELSRSLLVKLGEMLKDGLPFCVEADSIIFLNARPALAKAWSTPAPNYKVFRGAKLDYIILLETLKIDVEPRTQIFSYSNQLLTKKINVRTISVSLKLIDTNREKIISENSVNLDEARAQKHQNVCLPDGWVKSNAGIALLNTIDWALKELFSRFVR